MQILLSLSLIRVDGGTQSRASLNHDVVDEYAEAMRQGADFPPLVVYWDGTYYWMAEGFHRFAAGLTVGVNALMANVLDGSKRQALLHSLAANVRHGLRRTNADKRHAVGLMLRDPEWTEWSNEEIARHCSVDPKTVATVRKDLETALEIPELEVRKGADGKVYKTTNIGKAKTGVKPKKADEYGCTVCGEVFDRETWHCATCDNHWPAGEDTCPSCYQAPVVTTLKLVSKPEEPQGVDPDKALRATDLKKGLIFWKEAAEVYVRETHVLREENTRLRAELKKEKIEFNPSFDPDRDRDYWPEYDRSILFYPSDDFQGELIDCCTKELEAERDAILKNESLLYQQIADLQKTLEEVRKEREHWYGVAEKFREKFDDASKKQPAKAKELLALKSELESVKEELHQADLEIETVKNTRDSYYEKILELRSAMKPLYEELNRLREENAALQAENKKMNETGRESDYQEICSLVNQVGELETQIKKLQAQTKEPLDVTHLRSANEALRKEIKELRDKNTDLDARLLKEQLKASGLEGRIRIVEEINESLRSQFASAQSKFLELKKQKREAEQTSVPQQAELITVKPEQPKVPKKRGRKPKEALTSPIPQ